MRRSSARTAPPAAPPRGSGSGFRGRARRDGLRHAAVEPEALRVRVADFEGVLAAMRILIRDSGLVAAGLGLRLDVPAGEPVFLEAGIGQAGGHLGGRGCGSQGQHHT